MTSNRDDGKGHWPKGKARHPCPAGVMRLLRAVRTYQSVRRIGAELGTDGSTVSKWLRGKQNPDSDMQARILKRYK